MFTEESLIAKDNNVSSFQPVAVAIQIKGVLKLKIFTVAFKGDIERLFKDSRKELAATVQPVGRPCIHSRSEVLFMFSRVM